MYKVFIDAIFSNCNCLKHMEFKNDLELWRCPFEINLKVIIGANILNYLIKLIFITLEIKKKLP